MNIFKRLGAFFLDILQVVVFAVSIFLFIYLLVLQPHKIKGSSMEPNFHDKEYLLTDKVTYRFGEPKRGDIVVFKAPPDDKEEFIKRIIGLPGEQVMVQGGRVFVNGKQIKEEYLPAGKYTSGANFAIEGRVVTVPTNQYFLMGDNRDHSFDSRNFGPVNKTKFTGRAWLVYWPPQVAGIVQGANY